MAVAEIAGRPCLDRGRLCVKPELVFNSDIDVATGNVRFTGDVVVYGNVSESLKIQAGGMIEIRGSAYHARLIAGNSIIVHKNLIGGHLTVGGEMATYVRIAALIKRISPRLQALQRVFLQLRTQQRFSLQDLGSRGDGYLIKLILEMHFCEIPVLCAELWTLLDDLAKQAQERDEDVDNIWVAVQRISQCFIGANPLAIESVTELDIYRECLEEVCLHLENILSTEADIRVHYCQGARLEATGSITVTGPLVYGTMMSAGAHITICGSCRGGLYYAASSLTVNSAGVNESVRTCLAVDDGGFIRANALLPGTQLTIGQGQTVIRRTRRNVQFSFERDRWVEKAWSWKESLP